MKSSWMSYKNKIKIDRDTIKKIVSIKTKKWKKERKKEKEKKKTKKMPHIKCVR